MARAVKKERGVFERPKKSGIWWIRYADEFGRIHREKVGMKSAASEVYKQRKTEIRQGKFQPADIKNKHRNVLFAELIEDRMPAAKILKSSRNEFQRLNYWAKRFGHLAARSIVVKDIEAAKADLLQGIEHDPPRPLRPASVNRFLASLKTVFATGIHNGKIEANPALRVRPLKENNRRVRWLTDDEEQRLFKVLPARYHPLVFVALHTGMRKTEQLSLQWSDVDFKVGQVKVRESKAGKSRIIPMNDTLVETLRRLPRVLNNPYIFVGRADGERLTDLPREWERYIESAGIADFHWHDLRHTFASRMVMGGVPLRAVQELLGHQSLAMTERYSHLAPGYLKDAVSVLSKANQLAPELAPAISKVS
jgi:integrase